MVAFGKHVNHVLHTFKLPHAVRPDVLGLIPHGFRIPTQHMAIYLPESHLIGIYALDKPGLADRIGGQGLPLAVMLRDVGYHRMSVQLRVQVA